MSLPLKIRKKPYATKSQMGYLLLLLNVIFNFLVFSCDFFSALIETILHALLAELWLNHLPITGKWSLKVTSWKIYTFSEKYIVWLWWHWVESYTTYTALLTSERCFSPMKWGFLNFSFIDSKLNHDCR